MSGFVSSHLEAALIDQVVAGLFRGKACAFVPVMLGKDWALGVAVRDEPGFYPVKGKTFLGLPEASLWAESLNEHIGLEGREADVSVASSMRAI